MAGKLFLIALVLLAALGANAEGPAFTHALAGTDWASLTPSNALCSSGMSQSPVAIEDSMVAPASDPSPLIVNWTSSLMNFAVENLGVTVEIVITGTNTITPPSNIYTAPANSTGLTLTQFHFHTQSEHTVNGEYYPAELHFVHKDPTNGQTAVVGVFAAFSPDGSDNPDLDIFIPSIPQGFNQESAPIGTPLNLNNLLPKDKSYYYYSGSLTTPPCSQNVFWFVMRDPIFVSPSQMLTLELSFAHGGDVRANDRPVQALNGRTITLYEGNAASCNPNSLLPNTCYNAPGTSFVCCPGGCPVTPVDIPTCGY